MFLAYVIKQLRSLASPPTIVYHHIAAHQCFIMRSGGTQAEMYTVITPRMVRDRTIVYLVDIGGSAQPGPIQCAAFTIVVASPHATVKNWRKQGESPSLWYMPCWSEAELQACRRVTRPTDPEEAADQLRGARRLWATAGESVTSRVHQFGGIPRLAFSSDQSLREIQSMLHTAIVSCDLEMVAKALGRDLDLLTESSSWVLHYVVHEFKLVDIVFASRPIREAVWQRACDTYQDPRVLQLLSPLADATGKRKAASSKVDPPPQPKLAKETNEE